MKKISIFGFGLLLITLINPESIYTYSVPHIEGGSRQLSDFQGKKILITTLPVVQSAESDSMLYSLDTLAHARMANLAVIATPAYEDGFTVSEKEQLKQWYRSKLGNYITITDGLYTRKTSGAQQHPLFNWLTNVDKNENFDEDITSNGFKFFITKTGELYGILKPHTKISSTAVQNTLGIQ